MGTIVVHCALLEEIVNSTCSSRGSSGVAAVGAAVVWSQKAAATKRIHIG
jgi:hypothetical protein